jgi:hypothetical protein
MINVPCTYPYKAKPRSLFLGSLLFGGVAYFFANQALTNDRGMIIEHLITLDTAGATIAWWVLAALSAGFVVIALISGINGLLHPKVLRINVDSIELPHGLFQRLFARIPYSSITRISETEVHKQKFLYLHTGNKKYALTCGLLPNAQVYNDIKDFLLQVSSHR